MSKTVKKGYKQTKLGWIPEEWKISNLKDLTYIDLNSLSSKYSGEIRYVSLSDIYNGKMHPVILNFNSAPSRARRKTKIGDILLSTVRPNLKNFAIVREKGIIASTGFAVLTEKEASNDYIFQYLNSILAERQFHALTVGSNYPALNSSDVRALKIITPPLREQQKIAQILSTWDIAIDKTQELITQLQLRKKGLMQQLLSGKKRLKGFDSEWKEYKLENFFEERKETGYLNLTLLSIGIDGVYPQSDSEKKDTSNKNKSKYKRICKGDIGYNTMRMWQGRSALSRVEGIVSPAYTIVTPLNGSCPIFFSYLFKLEHVVHKFFRNSQGMVSDTLNCKFKDFKIVKLNLPNDKKEQQAIAKVLTTADKEIQHYQNYLEQLQTQKKGLMQQLLTGKTRVKLD